MTKTELQDIRKEVDKEVNKTIDGVFARLEAELNAPKTNSNRVKLVITVITLMIIDIIFSTIGLDYIQNIISSQNAIATIGILFNIGWLIVYMFVTEMMIFGKTQTRNYKF